MNSYSEVDGKLLRNSSLKYIAEKKFKSIKKHDNLKVILKKKKKEKNPSFDVYDLGENISYLSIDSNGNRIYSKKPVNNCIKVIEAFCKVISVNPSVITVNFHGKSYNNSIELFSVIDGSIIDIQVVS